MTKVVLDASALLALIFEEEGATIVKPLLKNAIISTINVAEVLTILRKSDVDIEASINYMKSMLKEIIQFNIDQCEVVANLYSLTKHLGLSLGDRACLALGQIMQLPIYTADRIWSQVKIEGVEIRLIR